MGSYTSLAPRRASLGVLELENDDLKAVQVYLPRGRGHRRRTRAAEIPLGVRTNLGYLAIMRADPGRAFSVWLEASRLRRGSGTAR
jgi:hypothetical protein